MGPAAESAAHLFQEFDRLGILDLQLFTRTDSLGPKKKVEPDPKTRVRFFDAVKRATDKANQRLGENPLNVDAMFAMTLG